MVWQLCIQYSNGSERVLRSYRSRETALRCVDAIYNANGYPLHLAYVVRSAQAVVPVSVAA
ncbi:family 2 glycosyl transferase [Oculatella sp. LEGE 06141]|uniref:family 2 glycosyl transferase n=1 Tax=Oculatella sp. LEGE 06141 TaxID=1828648 RepID=UPI00187E8639|nr:family 2 glycosyl transferase [Oculatella sp. LEGE 06141]MBE9178450.1 family 2 glycosyl transferase [Oculatella sp. LEGE 06141]